MKNNKSEKQTVTITKSKKQPKLNQHITLYALNGHGQRVLAVDPGSEQHVMLKSDGAKFDSVTSYSQVDHSKPWPKGRGQNEGRRKQAVMLENQSAPNPLVSSHVFDLIEASIKAWSQMN